MLSAYHHQDSRDLAKDCDGPSSDDAFRKLFSSTRPLSLQHQGSFRDLPDTRRGPWFHPWAFRSPLVIGSP